MNINNLKKEELLKLKEDIDNRLNYINSLKEDVKTSKEKNSLSDLVKGDKIFCISFRGDTIYHMDYVEISFYKKDDNDWLNYTTKHDTKPIGCSSAIHEDCMSNHYFLSEFFSSHMYFYTLKPETWRIDLNKEIERKVIYKNKIFDKQITIFKDNVQNLISSTEVDKFLSEIL